MDALRLTRTLEGGGEVELLGVAHRDDLKKGLALVQVRPPVFGLGTLGLRRLLPGPALPGPGPVRRTWAQAGWYAEGLGRLGEDPYVRAMAGLDYRFPFGLEVFGEVYHNGSGAGSEEGYASVPTGRAWEEGEIFLVGRWYSALNLGYDLTPLIRGEATWVQNWSDGSAMLVGGLSWDLADSVAIRTGVLLGLGRESEIRPSGLAPGTEFGDYGTSWFVEVKLSF